MDPSPPDPLSVLVEALERDGRVPLAWVVRWSAEGREPLAAAWDATDNPYAMTRLLELSRHPRVARVLYASLEIGIRPGYLEQHHKRRVALVDAIRREVPVPPTLREVLARTRRDAPR